jgi:6-phosphogluconolactonase
MRERYLNRREFNAALAGAAAASLTGRAAASRRDIPERSVLYSAVGDTLTQYDVSVASATLTPRASITLPAVIQYAWPHPSNRYLYVAMTGLARGGRDNASAEHWLYALRLGTNRLSVHGAPKALRQRPINNSVDASGLFALTCYSTPANLSVHRIAADGTLAEEIPQSAQLDLGVYPHQIRTLPSNRTVALVTRGTAATADKPAQRGAVKLFNVMRGRMTPLADLAHGAGPGFGYGPRHLDFHPSRRLAYIAVELQNQLHTHRLVGDGMSPEPAYVTPTTGDAPESRIRQLAGAVHVHPHGHVVYVSNRIGAPAGYSSAISYDDGGENNIAVFAINAGTGEPRPIQFVDPHGAHVRTFTIDPSGQLLIAATMTNLLVREAGMVRNVSAGLTVFRIAPDGKLAFAHKYDVDLPPGVQQMWVRAIPSA